MKPSLTWMSWLARAIIVISPVSSNKGWTDLKLKFFSKATLIYLLLFYGPMLLLVVASIINGDHSQIVMESMIILFKTYNLIDSFSVFFMLLFLPMSCIIPFKMSTGSPSISSIALARYHSWPKYGIIGLVGAFLFLPANSLCEYILVSSNLVTKYTDLI